MPHIYKCVRQKLVSHEHLKVNNYYIVNGMELWHGRHSNSKSVYILFQKPIHIHKSFALPWMVRFLQKKPIQRHATLAPSSVLIKVKLAGLIWYFCTALISPIILERKKTAHIIFASHSHNINATNVTIIE